MLNNKIYRYSLLLDQSGVHEHTAEYDFEEKGTTYVIPAESSYGGKTTRLKKEYIMQVESIIRQNMVTNIQFYTWYFEADRSEAERIVREKVKQTAKLHVATATCILNHINF